MTTVDVWIQDSWAGGENTLLNPELIEDNESVKIVNMVPRRNGTGISLRRGFAKEIDGLPGEVYSIFVKRKGSTGDRHLFAAINDNGTVKLNHYGEVDQSQSQFYPAATIASTITDPYGDLLERGDGSFLFNEYGTLDNWTSNATSLDDDSSQWNDGSSWSNPSHASLVLSVTVPSSDSVVSITTTAVPTVDIGRFHVYHKKSGAVSWVDDGISHFGDIPSFSVASADGGVYYIKLDFLDGDSTLSEHSSGVVDGISIGRLGSATTIYTFSTAPEDFTGISFADWDGDRFFFAHEDEGLFTWNFSGTASMVQDKSAVGTVYMNAGYRNLVQHNGRLFMSLSNDSTPTVLVCGSNDAVNARWESWSGSAASDGGSVDAAPYGSAVKGLASTYAGLMILKEDGIYLWTYSDAYAPWDAINSSIELVNGGIGCVGEETVARDGNSVYFIGKSDSGSLALYKYQDSTVSAVSDKIPSLIASVKSSNGFSDQFYGSMVDGYYLMLCRGSDGLRRVVAMFDTYTGAWSEVTSPTALSMVRSIGDPYVMLGGYDGAIYRYPSDNYYDADGEAIKWEVVGKRVLADAPESEKYWRTNWIDIDTDGVNVINGEVILDNGRKIYCRPITVASNASDYWTSYVLPDTDGSSESLWNDGTTWGASYSMDKYHMETGDRSYGAQLRLYGESTSRISLNRVGIGFRGRRTKSDRNA